MKRWFENKYCKTCDHGSGWILTLDPTSKQYVRKRCEDDSHIATNGFDNVTQYLAKEFHSFLKNK